MRHPSRTTPGMLQTLRHLKSKIATVVKMDKEETDQDILTGEQIAGTTLPVSPTVQSPAKPSKRNACTTIYFYVSAVS